MLMVQTLLPIFAVIGIGWLAVRSGYLDRGVVAPAGQVVMRVALPAMIFLALAGSPGGQAFDLAFLLVYGAASLGVMALCYALARLVMGLSKPEAAVIGLGVSMANSGFMGFPIGQAVLGQETAIRIFAHVLIVENLVILPLALLVLATAGDSSAPRPRLLREMIRNPLMIALVAGGVVSSVGIGLPAPASAVLEFLGRMSAPLALLVIGGMLASLPASGRAGAMALMVAGKLVVHPLLVALGVALVPGVTPALALGGVLFAAMPMITIFPLLSARVGQGQSAAFGLLIATSVCFITLPILIHLLEL